MHTHETPASDRADTSSADDTLHLYLREIARHPLLSRFEETELSKRVAAGDELARRRMVSRLPPSWPGRPTSLNGGIPCTTIAVFGNRR